LAGNIPEDYYAMADSTQMLKSATFKTFEAFITERILARR
jgi:hypothetical protein